MILNEVNLAGRIYNIVERKTSTGKTISEFGLSVYSGKNKEGKSQYKFMTCKIWDKVEKTSDEVVIKGRLAFDVWEKDGKELSKPYILCESIAPSSYAVDSHKKQVVNMEDDEIPF